MNLFSQRMGLKPVKSIIQVDSMDQDLRTGIWNALTFCYWNKLDPAGIGLKHIKVVGLFRTVWVKYFKRPLDTMGNWRDAYKAIRKYFFNAEWNEVYDFIEFIANNYPDNKVNTEFMESCNSVLKNELSAYRFLGGKIAKITSEEEISEIEEALKISDPLKAVNTHLKAALDLLTDRKSPDYRNSIKESISALEAGCNLITKENTG